MRDSTRFGMPPMQNRMGEFVECCRNSPESWVSGYRSAFAVHRSAFTAHRRVKSRFIAESSRGSPRLDSAVNLALTKNPKRLRMRPFTFQLLFQSTDNTSKTLVEPMKTKLT